MLSADTLISTLVGVFAGWATTHLYFRKATPAEKIADQIKTGLQKALLPVLYPHYFNHEKALTVHPEQPAPPNTDIPHVEHAVFAEKTVRVNQKADVLIKIKDTGFDLVNPTGVMVRDHKDNRLAVVPIGFGFVQITFHVAANERPGIHRLTVELRDLGHHTRGKPNQNIQSLLFTVVKGDEA